MNTSLLTLNLINSGPVSLSLRQLILFHIQASFSPDESAHTKLPLCFNVCQLCRRCAAKLWQYCWKCVGTHGASKQEFTVQSQVLKQPFFFYSKRERGRQKVIKKMARGSENQSSGFTALDWTDMSGLQRKLSHGYLLATGQGAWPLTGTTLSAASLQLYRAGWGSVTSWQRLGCEVTAVGKWTLDHIVISHRNNTSSLGVKCLYFHRQPAGN